MSPKINVLVIEDHALVLEGIKLLIEKKPNLKVTATAIDEDSAKALIDKQTFGLILVDLCLKKGSGLTLISHARTKDPKVPILVLSMYDEKAVGPRALQAGASGYVMKSSAPEELLSAIECVLEGRIYLSAETQELIKDSKNALAEQGPQSSPSVLLTERELEIYCALGFGKGTREIAKTLGISPKTVDAHCSNIKDKLSIHNINELIHSAVIWNQQNLA